jgi:hypothetical protein
MRVVNAWHASSRVGGWDLIGKSLGLAAACKRRSTPRSWGIVILPHKHAILDIVSWWIVASYARVIFVVLLVTYVLESLTGGAKG